MTHCSACRTSGETARRRQTAQVTVRLRVRRIMGPPMKPVRKVRVAIVTDMDVARTILHARRISADLGFGVPEQNRVATAASELARNILKYAGTGHVTISPLEYGGRTGVEIVAEDRGPGIADIELAVKDRYSS